MPRITFLFIGLLLSTLLLGCQSTAPDAASSSDTGFQLTFPKDQHQAVHQAAVETLRDHDYRIARNDYRFGTITTYPKEAATSAEFWIDDAVSAQQRRADTLNAQQRTVTVRVRPHPKQKLDYTMTIEVMIERLQRPDRYLTHSATGRATASYSDVPMHLQDRGIDGPYAHELTRDSSLERCLLEAIKTAVQ